MKDQAFPIYELVKEISKISFSDVIAALTFGRPWVIAVASLVSVYTIISVPLSFFTLTSSSTDYFIGLFSRQCVSKLTTTVLEGTTSL